MGLTPYADNSDDSLLVFYDFFLVACKYADLTYSGDDSKLEMVKKATLEVMDKLMKVKEQKKALKETMEKTADYLKTESAKGADGVSTHKIAADVENFLYQAKGALDLFANKLLNEIIGFKGKFNHERINKYLRNHVHLDKEAVSAINDLLNRDWDIWLKDLIDERNYHHEGNFKISNMQYVSGKPTVILEKLDGTKIADLIEYLEVHWKNLIGLLSDLIWLIYASKNPALKVIRVGREMFISPDSPDYDRFIVKREI